MVSMSYMLFMHYMFYMLLMDAPARSCRGRGWSECIGCLCLCTI